MAREIRELKSSLRGIIGFGLTPFNDDLSLNLESLRQNAAKLAESCDIIVPLAGNEEIFSLSPEEHRRVGREVVEEVHGKKPVVVGVGFSVPLARELAQAAESYGGDGVLILPPYFTQANDEGLYDYYRAIATTTKLGAILFQTLSLNFSTALLRRLAEVPSIIGLKDEHGDLHQFVRQWEAVGDRLELLCGVGEILAPSYFALGVKAFTSGLVNFMPGTCTRILKHLRAGEMGAAARLVEAETIPIYDLRAKRPGYRTLVIKEATNLCGMKVGPASHPFLMLIARNAQSSCAAGSRERLMSAA